MVEYERVENERTNDECKTQKLIIEMVNNINNKELLIKIYTFIKAWIE